MDFKKFTKTVDTLVKSWRQFTVALNEVIDSTTKAFERLREVRQKVMAAFFPRKYGMSLVKKNERHPRCFYRPIVRRNLPYQRRRF